MDLAVDREDARRPVPRWSGFETKLGITKDEQEPIFIVGRRARPGV